MRNFKFWSLLCSILLGASLWTQAQLTVSPVVTNAKCKGQCNGLVDVVVTGGTSPYTFSLNNGAAQSNPAFTGLCAGGYSIKVLDAQGLDKIVTFQVTEPALLEAKVMGAGNLCSITPNTCLSAQVNGGTPPYTYAWSTGATTQQVCNITAGTVTITDANGCVISATGSAADVVLHINGQVQDVSCNGCSDGVLEVVASGGIPPYQFQLNGGIFVAGSGAVGNQFSFVNLSPGTYVVNVKDSQPNPCIKTITLNTSTLTLSGQVTPDDCSPANTGSVTLTPSGGAPPYTYSLLQLSPVGMWSTIVSGQTSNIFANLPIGVYAAFCYDANSESAQFGEFTISGQNISVEVEKINCPGGGLPCLKAIVTGGTAPFTYEWFEYNNATPVSLQDEFCMTSGNYHTLKVKDANGCTALTYFHQNTVSLKGKIVRSGTGCNFTPNTCLGVELSNAIAPLTYKWYDVAAPTVILSTQSQLCNLNQNINYKVEVTDALGCVITLTRNANSLYFTLNPVVRQNTCGNAMQGIFDSNFDVSYFGESPILFQIKNNTTGVTVNSFYSGLANVDAGVYTITAIDAGGCVQTESVTIIDSCSVNTPLSAIIDNQTNTLCNGGNSGTVKLIAQGGASPYTFQIQGPGGMKTNTNGFFDGLVAGSYTGVVTDANGASFSLTFAINQPAAISITEQITQPNCSGSAGAIDATVSGGVGPYQFAWKIQGTTTVVATTEDLFQAAPGTYVLHVYDANQCVSEKVYTIAPSGSFIDLNLTKQNASCGQNNGIMSVNPSGGVAPYAFSWSNGSTQASIGNLAPGQYTITVTDANGCQKSATETIGQNNNLLLNISKQNASCGQNNGIMSATASGGTAPYSFAWSNGATTSAISSLAAGQYTVTVTDGAGCIKSATETIQSQGNAQIGVSSNIPNPQICVGGTLQLIANGGLTYSWAPNAGLSSTSGGSVLASPAQTTTYTVTGATGTNCTGTATITVIVNQPPVVTAVPALSTICAGQSVVLNATGSGNIQSAKWNGPGVNNVPGLTITVSPTQTSYYIFSMEGNGAGCVSKDTVKVIVTNSIVVNAVVTKPACGQANGIIDLAISGGAAPYSVVWSNGATSVAINNLQAGVYTYTVTDAQGCSKTESVTVNPATSWTVNEVKTNAGCNNSGSINLTIVGGTPNLQYTYLWSNGATTQDIANLAPGVYSVTVSDNQGCTYANQYNILGGQAPVINSSVIAASCNTCANGGFELNVTGGQAPYTYQFNGQTGTSGFFNNLIPGTYVVNVVDAAGCSQFYTVVVPVGQTGVLTLNLIGKSNVSCNGGSNGKINVQGVGGVPPYQYSIGNGVFQNVGEFNNLPVGGYIVQVKDASGAIESLQVVIEQPNPIQITLAANTVSCQGGADGEVISTVAGGLPPYLYQWNTGAFAPNLSGVPAGHYVLTVTDANGCVKVADKNVVVNANPDCVWPGDANSDHFANNADVYAIGYAFGSNGPARPNATLDWNAQAAFNWQGFLPNGVNFKHADTDGNGHIDTLDFNAINLHYGMQHNKTDDTTGTGPALYIVAPADTVDAGSPITLEIMYGTADQPVDSVYTLSFTMNYDNIPVLENSLSIGTEGSWFGVRGIDQYHVYKDFYADALVDVGLTRINQDNVSGFGRIALADIVTDNISGKITGESGVLPMNISFSNVIAVDYNGQPIEVSKVSKTIYIRDKAASSRADLLQSQVKLYPNPTRDLVNISFDGLTVSKVEVVDALGRSVLTTNPQTTSTTLNLAGQPSGLYQVVLHTAEGKVVKPLVVN